MSVPQPVSHELKRSDADLVTVFRQLQSKYGVADLLEIPYDYLIHILYRRKDREKYHTFAIPKRSGSPRIISAPPKDLAILQSKLNKVLQLVYKPKPCVHGFVLGRSIMTNAEPHVGKKWVLNVDLKDFFPAINFGRVRGVLMAPPYRVPVPAATAIAQICTADGVLPQGAPSSPILANMVCARLDGQLMAFARRHRLTYTRYCDDITFSSRRFALPDEIAAAGAGWIGEDVVLGGPLLDVIAANGFEINQAKTRLQLNSRHQEVTGLTVNSFPNVARYYIRQLRAMLYAWRRHGLMQAALVFGQKYYRGQASSGAPDVLFRRVLRGRIEYVGMVRGRSDPVYCRLRSMLHELDPTAIAAPPLASAYRVVRHSAGGDHWTRLYQRWGDSVFLLEVVRQGATNSGTAFALYPDAVGTAAHNLTGTVRLRTQAASVVMSSAKLHGLGRKEIDCAIVPYTHNTACVPSDRRLPNPGEEIGIVGFATVPSRHPGLGLYVGKVESLRMNYKKTITFIQVSVASGGGLSGSPVFDSRGRVLGVVVESVYERTDAGVPHREYCTVLPIEHLLQIGMTDPDHQLPLPAEP